MASVDETEKEILEFWKKDKTFEKSLEKTKKGKPYIFYDGPPFATGLPHYGSYLGSIVKDLFGRFWTMQGRYVKRVWGWDCHGLPIETIAEKELNINSKNEIENMGVKKFNNFCRSKVLQYTKEWEKLIERIGRWVDFKNGYKTMDNSYIESVWWAFKKLYDKGYLYEGEKILMYCPRCSTPLAKSEIAMDNSYKTIKDLSVVVKFRLLDEKNTYALSWTTTPWTLPSNLALTVNPKIDYAFVEDKNDKKTYLLAKSLIKNFYNSEKDYTIKRTMKGNELEGKKYEPLYPYFKDTKNAFRILLGDFVTEDEGTGIVHTAPAFGEDDNSVCRKYNIPIVQPVDERGHFTKEVKDYSGKYVHDINEQIVIDLKKAGKAVFSKKIEHEYPFCYRCDTKLMYRALPAWFVDIQKIKPKLLELNKKLNWHPEFLKEGRVKYTIETAPDWNVTRNRYWASAIPIWKAKSGKIKVIGSIDELKKYAKRLPKGDIDLHKDYLDEVKLEIDGEEYTRIPEVLDCWFESGAMPFAQFHYPFENKKYFEDNFPSQFVAEYIAQVRAWFYYMIVLSAIIFDDIPFENVVVTGTVLAKDGQKMSKSKGNFTDPEILIKKYGVDALRFYLLSNQVMNADNLNFSDEGVEDCYRKVVTLLYNVNNFYSLSRSKGDEKYSDSDNVLDKWIVSKLNFMLVEVERQLKDYNTIKASAEIRSFVDDLSTWYVRASRERFNSGDKNVGKTLRYVLNETSKAIAPIIPFVAEKIYQNLNGKKKSVHLEDWQKANKRKISEKVLKDMGNAREIVSLALKERDVAGIALKQPLAELVIFGEKLSKDYIDLIANEVNVKKVTLKSLKAGEKFKVELDTALTEELEAEGYARELSRQIQAFRKKLGLNKNDKVKTYIITDDNFRKILESQKKMIKERTNSHELEIVLGSKEKFKNKTEFRIKEKRGELAIVGK